MLDYIQQQLDTSQFEIVTDFQLQIEHALDLQNRELVLFIDASVACEEAFDFAELHAASIVQTERQLLYLPAGDSFCASER